MARNSNSNANQQPTPQEVKYVTVKNKKTGKSFTVTKAYYDEYFAKVPHLVVVKEITKEIAKKKEEEK